ncbi:hypothetical protein VNO77_02974 [Canavalia gladiata]|uniref:Uncharacterized protein n=1 Tax=Canavalia gladiata TaxID=3824 RepID=A0AAN9N0E7_CANGL
MISSLKQGMLFCTLRQPCSVYLDVSHERDVRERRSVIDSSFLVPGRRLNDRQKESISLEQIDVIYPHFPFRSSSSISSWNRDKYGYKCIDHLGKSGLRASKGIFRAYNSNMSVPIAEGSTWVTIRARRCNRLETRFCPVNNAHGKALAMEQMEAISSDIMVQDPSLPMHASRKFPMHQGKGGPRSVHNPMVPVLVRQQGKASTSGSSEARKSYLPHVSRIGVSHEQISDSVDARSTLLSQKSGHSLLESKWVKIVKLHDKDSPLPQGLVSSTVDAEDSQVSFHPHSQRFNKVMNKARHCQTVAMD